MGEYRISFLTGDGIGPIICSYAQKIITSLGLRYGFSAAFDYLPFGKSAYEKLGDPLPLETIDKLRRSDASFLFAVDGSGIPGPTPVGRLRKALSLFAEVRAIKAVDGQSALGRNINMSFVREITEGFLCDRNLESGMGEWKTDPDTACSIRVIRRSASLRIANFAFEYAKKNCYEKVTAVHKASIFKTTCGLFLSCCREVALKYPEIKYEEMTADDVAGNLIYSPEKFGVILTTNMFGDILSDEGVALVNGICAGINIGDDSVVYMPVRHSPSYKEVETDSFDVNGSLFCIVEMLKNIGELSAAQELNSKIVGKSISGASGLDSLNF